MIIKLSDIMNASVSELSDYDMQLAFEIEAVERQLNFPERDDKSWREKAMKARDHMKRTRALVRTRLDKLYYGEDRLLHGVILAEVRKTMSVGRFMELVHKAKRNAGLM
ncbi:hypothetical protein BAHKABFF_00001 [Salmonella phage CF-SP1]|nr:hypothetical protein BAHKABFF_00001 [Salmonella phage CF-SP1]